MKIFFRFCKESVGRVRANRYGPSYTPHSQSHRYSFAVKNLFWLFLLLNTRARLNKSWIVPARLTPLSLKFMNSPLSIGILIQFGICLHEIFHSLKETWILL